jgi:glycosyltransferase involved in cell wall biosynthesis
MSALSESNIEKPILLVVLATNAIGGAETLTRTLIGGLLPEFRVVLLAHAAVVPIFEDIIATECSSGERNDGVALITFESFGLTNPFDYSRHSFLAYAKAIAEVAASCNADLVYGVTHSSTLYITLAAWRHFHSLRGCVFVGSLHGSLVGYFEQRGYGATPFERILIRLALVTCHAVITPSAGVRSELIEKFNGHPEKVLYVHNGFDLIRIKSLAMTPLSQAKTCPWILTCCRLQDQKDFHTLVAAFAQLDTSPLPELIVVGGGSMQEQIEAWARQYGVHDRLRITGFVGNPFQWIRQADIFVLSSHYEGFGNVIVEAMTLGVPVVASNCRWGPSEVVVPGTSGALFEPGDVDTLAHVIQEWLDHPKLRSTLAKGALERSECFRMENMTAGYASIFHSLCKTGQTSSR